MLPTFSHTLKEEKREKASSIHICAMIYVSLPSLYMYRDVFNIEMALMSIFEILFKCLLATILIIWFFGFGILRKMKRS